MNKKKSKGEDIFQRSKQLVSEFCVLLFQNYQTAFLRFGQRDAYPRKGFWVYYDSYADFKRHQKRTKFLSFSTISIVMSIVIVELCINLIFPIIFRSEASSGSSWSQPGQADFLSGQGDRGIAQNKTSIALRANVVFMDDHDKKSLSRGYSPMSDGLSQTDIMGINDAVIAINQGYSYNTETSLPMPSNAVKSLWEDESGKVFISTWGGLAILDTKRTAARNDDEIIAEYSTGNNLLPSNFVYSSWLDYDKKLLYVSTWGGLAVLDISRGFQSPRQVFVYSSDSTPSIPFNKVRQAYLTPGGTIYISTDGGGLAMIDTKDTERTDDDELIGVYGSKSDISLGSDRIYGSFLQENILYIATWGSGVWEIDTKGTKELSDDSLLGTKYVGKKTQTMLISDDKQFFGFSGGGFVMKEGSLEQEYLTGKNVSGFSWDETSQVLTVSTQGEGVYHFLHDDGELAQIDRLGPDTSPNISSALASAVIVDALTGAQFIGTEDSGVQIITAGQTNDSGEYVSAPKNISSGMPAALSWEGDNLTNTKIRIRTGSSIAVWEADFSGAIPAEITDLWGGRFPEVRYSAERMIMSGKTSDAGGASFNIGPEDQGNRFQKDSVIRLYIKVNTEDPDFKATLFADDWKNESADFLVRNEWQEVKLIMKSSFSKVGISMRWGKAWKPSDSIEIAGLSVESPTGWTDWTQPLVDNKYSIVKADFVEGEWWQYKISMKQENNGKNPRVTAIKAWNDFSKSGEYISPVIMMPIAAFHGEFRAITEVPAGTDISFYGRAIGQEGKDASDWEPLVSGKNLNVSAGQEWQYKAVLETGSVSSTPTISKVEVKYLVGGK